MELRAFVKEVLCDVIGGISDAQKKKREGVPLSRL